MEILEQVLPVIDSEFENGSFPHSEMEQQLQSQNSCCRDQEICFCSLLHLSTPVKSTVFFIFLKDSKLYSSELCPVGRQLT